MQEIDLNLIDATSEQPRKTFYQDTLEELAQSIRERGVLEPIVVRPVGSGRYQIVMGERRFRAARMAGLSKIPAIVRELNDEEAKADALLENFQREDLNPIERAKAIQELLTFMSWQQCAKTLGVTEATLRKYLELLELPESIQAELAKRDSEGVFLESHARLLRALSGDESTQIRLAGKIKAENLSTADTAKLIDAIKEMPEKKEAFLRVPLHVTHEILRHSGKSSERTRRFKPQTAEQHMKQMLKAASVMYDLLDPNVIAYLSNEQANQLLSTISELADAAVKFGQQLRSALQRSDFGFKEIYIHCPLCGRIELVGSVRCAVCWTVLKRCCDCGNYDQVYQQCSVTGHNVYRSDAESPDENSLSYRCENYKPKFEAKKAA